MPKQRGFTNLKRSRVASSVRELSAEDVEMLGIELSQFSVAPRPVALSPFAFDMDDVEQGARVASVACIRQLWAGEYSMAVGSLAEANRELAIVLQACTANTYRPADREAYAKASALCLEGTLCNLVCAKSQKAVPLFTAATSVMTYKLQLSMPLWASLRLLHRGALMGESWTKQIIAEAREHRPPPREPLVRAVHCTVFDNYTRRCLYKSHVSAGEGGYRLDMTNWGIMRVPQRLLPSNFDGRDIFNNLFRSDISLSTFIGYFAWNNLQIIQNKQSRFVRFMKAAATGELLKRPDYKSDWVCEFEWQRPMWGRLQAKADDVEHEATVQLRSCPAEAWVNMQGGDGLSIMRLNQMIAQNPETYLETAPALVPVLGEYPHGHHHLLHTVHRGFKPFIMRCAEECRNPAIQEDPAEVKHHNSHLYFHWKMVRACSEYLHEISRGTGGVDFEDVPAFLRAAENNIDLAWVAHYLYDGGYLILDFKQSMRSNDSDGLDLNWREFVTLARAANSLFYPTSFPVYPDRVP